MDGPFSSCKIVLAEDNPADVRLVREALREHDIACELKVMSDGEDVFRYFSAFDSDTEQKCPDVILLDLHLPKHDGIDLLRHLRTSERCGRTPVVVLTSSDARWDRQSAEANAAVHYFRKPSSLEQFMTLGSVIKDVLDRASRS